MKKILRIDVTQTRVFPVDRLPIATLTMPGPAQAFKERFGWARTSTPTPGEIRYEGGVAQADGAPPVQIPLLDMNAQRIGFSVVGDSNSANRVFGEISAFLESIDSSGNWKGTEPVVLTQDTSAVVQLDLDWRALFAPRFLSFQEQAISKIGEKVSAEAILRSFSLSFRISFDGIPPAVAAHSITLLDKMLTIEPRINSPLADRVFFTASPTDSDTHLSLVRDLEKMLQADSHPAGGDAGDVKSELPRSPASASTRRRRLPKNAKQ